MVSLVVYALMFPALSCRPTPASVVEAMNMSGTLKTALRSYYVEYGAYPDGGQAAALRALLGDNKRRIVFLELSPRHHKQNGAGELLDPWGTPYQINFLEGAEVVVRSAGKNRRFESTDGPDDLSTSQ